VDRLTISECPQIQPKQLPDDIQDTSLQNSRRFLRDKPYNIKMLVKFETVA